MEKDNYFILDWEKIKNEHPNWAVYVSNYCKKAIIFDEETTATCNAIYEEYRQATAYRAIVNYLISRSHLI